MSENINTVALTPMSDSFMRYNRRRTVRLMFFKTVQVCCCSGDLNLIETDAMEKKDFVRTESYFLRLRPTGARKVTEEVNTWLNKTFEHQGNEGIWSFVMLLKTRELAQYLTGKKRTLDFKSPEFSLDRQDSNEMRHKILDISYKNWKDMGFSKVSLHYLKQNDKSGTPFAMNAHLRKRV